MNRKCSTKASTPQKRHKKSIKSTPKKIRTTPMKTRSSSRILPISPISQSMRQSTIKDFFKPVSPSLDAPLDTSRDSSPVRSVGPKTRMDRSLPLSPIFGSSKRNSFKKKESKVRKKLKINEDINKDINKDINMDIVSDTENKCQTNENNSFYKTVDNINSKDILEMSVSDQTLYTTACDLSFESHVIKQTSNEVMDSKIDQSLNQMMDQMKINQNVCLKVSDNDSQTVETKLENNINTNPLVEKSNADIVSPQSVAHILHIEREDQVLESKTTVSSDDEMEVPVFKVPKPVFRKANKEKINFNNYVDKEKRNKMQYFYTNIQRICKDKQMLKIEPIIENNQLNQSEESVNNHNESDTHLSHFTKPIIGIDIFCEYISKTLKECVNEETKAQHLSKTMNKLIYLPLSRFAALSPLYIARLDQIERQILVLHIIKLVSIEESVFTFNIIERKVIRTLCDNQLEIKLSAIVRQFYQIIYTYSLDFQKSPTEESKCDIIWKLSFSMPNVIRIMIQIIKSCQFEMEGISIEEELIKLLYIAICLSLENRLIQNYNWLYTLKQFIAVLVQIIAFNEENISDLVKQLLSFIKLNDSLNINLCLHIVSMLPLNVDFALKRQFCISVIQLFTTDIISDQTLSLDDLQSILSLINWKKLSPEEKYGIIQLIGLSLDLPFDLIEFKETITRLLSDLTFFINQSVPNVSNFEFSDIHKMVMILKSKIQVCASSLSRE